MIELQVERLPAPTSHLAGLSLGNLASMKHKGQKSDPKLLALQTLEKMKLVHDLGGIQVLLPPPERPHQKLLEALGLDKPTKALEDQMNSSAHIWMANAATCAPSCDTTDGNVHISMANLASNFHRAIDAQETFELFKKVFPTFEIHPPLPAYGPLFDEGSANHLRVAGRHLFTYGRTLEECPTQQYPARQTREASEACARKLHLKSPLFAPQNPTLIDAGFFHTDLLVAAHGNQIFYHQECEKMLQPLLDDPSVEGIAVHISLEEALESYLFNAQLFTGADNKLHAILPLECQELPQLPFENVHFVDLSQSMRGGGGPACLRLPLLLTPEELATLPSPYLFTEERYLDLKSKL